MKYHIREDPQFNLSNCRYKVNDSSFLINPYELDNIDGSMRYHNDLDGGLCLECTSKVLGLSIKETKKTEYFY